MTQPRRFDWDEAVRLHADGLTYAAIARRLGVSPKSVTNAVNGRRPVARPAPARSAKVDRVEASRLYLLGWSYPRIAAHLGASYSAVVTATEKIRRASGPRPTGMIPRPLAERFWEKVARGRRDECWEWTAFRVPGPHPYGEFRRSLHKHDRAHRVAYELAVGPIPDGLCVLHSCDNPPCCNPRHLSLGDRAENVRQMAERGRAHWSPGRVPAWQGRGASS